MQVCHFPGVNFPESPVFECFAVDLVFVAFWLRGYGLPAAYESAWQRVPDDRVRTLYSFLFGVRKLAVAVSLA